jgi:uncharacterized membrane protein
MNLRLHNTNRIHNFSDGVFGVAATALIVLVTSDFTNKLRSAALDANTGADLDTLQSLIGGVDLLVWLLSVMVVATFWIAHHNMFQLIVHTDRWLLWCNTFFLMAVTFVPFPTAVLARLGPQRNTIALYGITLIVCSLGLFLIWQRAAMNRALFRAGVSNKLIRSVRRQILLGPLVYAVAIGIGWYLPKVSVALFAIVQLAYMLPGNIDRDAPVALTEPD